MSSEDCADPVFAAARAAARRLAPALGERIEVEVEAALHAQEQPQQYCDPISLGGLLVSVATLAWTVYADLRSKAPQPSAEIVARTVRVQLRDEGAIAPEQRDRVIEVVVDEVLRTAPKSE